jgi:Domain of unknown function (DUF5615)
MTKCRLLFDEHVGRSLASALRRKEPTIDIVRVGMSGAPPIGTPDPDLLIAAETKKRVLITKDAKSMKRHANNHLAAGRHTGGVFVLQKGFPLRRYTEELLLIWYASSAEEWRDVFDYTPF